MSDLLDDVPLIDHHCHGVRTAVGTAVEFESDLTESAGPGRWHGSMFDTQAGLAVLRWCPPLLNLPPHCTAEDYLHRRAELGIDTVNERLLAATGITEFLVDTGFCTTELTPPADLAALAGGRAHEIVRLEHVAESVVGATHYPGAFTTALSERSRHAVATKSIAAYRIGLDFDPTRPAPADVQAAADRWARAAEKGGPRRLTDPVLIRFGIWAALDLGLPLQFHVGYGDADVDLRRCDPLHLTAFLRATREHDVPITLLHNYPFQRHAGYLAQVFDHVFVDVGLAVQNVGTGAAAVLAQLLDLAPYGSVLFSTDAFALPELFVTSTALFRQALSAFLDAGIRDGAWSAAAAERIATMIGSSNARRAYGLDQM